MPQRLRALVVDDMAIQGTLLRARLALLSVDAVQVETAQGALRMLERGRWDLVLLDCHMPVTSGYELARSIRSRAGSVPRLIAVSASAGPGHLARCRQAGFDDVLDKPVTTADLAALLAGLAPSSAHAPIQGVADHSSAGVLGELQASLEGEWRLIWAARLRGDVPEVRYRAHRMKGAALLFGSRAIADAAAHIEDCASAGCMPAVEAFMALKACVAPLP